MEGDLEPLEIQSRTAGAELTDDDLEQVVGGLERPWTRWDAAVRSAAGAAEGDPPAFDLQRLALGGS
jgi:hypothetical protein